MMQMGINETMVFGFVDPQSNFKALDIFKHMEQYLLNVKDLLTYLKNYVPHELVHFSGNIYTTKKPMTA